MSDNDVSVTDLGLAEKINMDEVIRTTVAQMFENDNDVATLEVVLNGTDAPEAPRVEIQLKLVSINGVPTGNS